MNKHEFITLFESYINKGLSQYPARSRNESLYSITENEITVDPELWNLLSKYKRDRLTGFGKKVMYEFKISTLRKKE